MSNDILMKTCTECNKPLPATEEFFSKQKRGLYGLRAACKVCTSIKNEVWRSANKERIAKRNREYNRENKERIDAYNRQRYIDNKEQIDTRNKRYRLNHKKEMSEYQKQYKELNRDSEREKDRRYYLANTEKILEYTKQYKKMNPEKRRMWHLRRMARKQQLPDTFTVEQWQVCLEYHHGRCVVCGNQLRDLFGVIPHADHWLPLASPECLGTVAENMICLCSSCNLSKGAKPPADWLKQEYGTRKANIILARVQEYFAWVLSQNNQEQSA